ncbi:MAG: non-heme iron oxygenase ferredoxin subunit [Dehalococcoidia bacterium]
MSEVGTWTRVARVDDIPEDEMIGVNVDGHKVALYHLETGEIRATANVCTHEFALLSDGWLEGCEVECPLHSGRFDVRSGRGLCAPVERDLAVYPVEVKAGAIYIALPQSQG